MKRRYHLVRRGIASGRCSSAAVCSPAKTSCSPSARSASTLVAPSKTLTLPEDRGWHHTDCERRGGWFYASVLDASVLVMPDVETAEFVKLAETTYRDVNIGLANELARFAQSRGVDAIAAFGAANTQPFSNLHAPELASAATASRCIRTSC